MTAIEEKVDGLEVDYDNSASESYLIIKAGDRKSILKYQSAMVSYNKIKHIIPFEIKYNDGNCYCYYNITSKLPLQTYFKRRKLTGDEFIGILSDITGTIVNSSGYLLSSTGFLTEAGFIYINPATLDVQLIYLPIKRQCDVSSEVRELVIDLVINHAILEERTNDNFLQRILSFVRNEAFSVSDFYKHLDRLAAGREENRSEIQKEELSECNTVNSITEINEGTVVKITDKNAKDKNTKGEYLIDKNDIEKNPKFKISKDKNVTDENTKEVKVSGKAGIKLPVVMLLLQIVIITVFLVYIRFVPNNGNRGFAVQVALIMFAAAIEILVFRKLMQTGVFKIAKSIDSSNSYETELDNMRPALDIMAPGIIAVNDIEQECFINYDTCSNSEHEHNSIDCPNEKYNTVMLSPDMLEKPYLIEKYNPQTKKIIIDKEEFLIGRLEGQVDYVTSNSAIGKIHACITVKNGGCHVTDLNSVNGTFIDGIRIDSNREYELKTNNIIAFANSEFIFISGR